MSNIIFYTRKNEVYSDSPKVFNLSYVEDGDKYWIEYNHLQLTLNFTILKNGYFVTVSTIDDVSLYSGGVSDMENLIEILERFRCFFSANTISDGEGNDETEEKVEVERLNYSERKRRGNFMSNKIFYTQKNEIMFDEPRVLNLSDVYVGKDDWVEYKIVYESIPMTLRFSEIGDTRFVVVSSSYHLADTSDTREILLYSGLVTSEDALLGILEKCRIDIISERDEKGGYGEADDEPEEKVEVEMVNHPAHYNDGKIECIDAMISAFGNNEVMSFCKVNAFKYIWRANKKGGVEDIKKAAWYLNKYVELAGVTEKE